MRRISRVPPRRFQFEPLEERALLATLVALIDTGIDLTDASAIDYYDFTAAYDAYNEVTVAEGGRDVVQDTSGQHGHGSSVADWIIQGIQDTKAQPGAGQADVKILPIRDTTPDSRIDGSAVIRGIYWAVDHGASVINLSVNFSGDFRLYDSSSPHNGSTVSQAIAYAGSKGVMVVTGPGNGSLSIDGQVVFPPYADDPIYSSASPLPTNLLVAAAVDSSGNLSSLSNWGPIHVDLGAYAGPSGYTSFSSGYAAGVSAVIASLLPDGHTANDVLDAIESSVTPKAQSVGAWSKTGGVINPQGAVARILAAGTAIDAGGSASGSYTADAYFRGGQTISVNRSIDTSGVSDPASQSVYQTQRSGDFTYTISNLIPNQPYVVRLDFAELSVNAQGKRLFNVSINGSNVLSSFDLFAAAGGMDRAVSREFQATTNASGQIILSFSSQTGGAVVNGIKVTPAPDLARGKQATASSTEGADYVASQALDGDSGTRWSSGQWLQNGLTTAWLSIDLGQSYAISQVRLNWEAAIAVDYQIQVSDDGSTWTTIKTVTGNQTAGPVRFTDLAGQGRYIRVYCTKTTSNINNFSLYDFEVYGTAASSDLAQGRTVTSSTVESAGYLPGKAVDGDSTTRWSSGQWLQGTNVGWIAVDLGGTYEIQSVQLNWEAAYAADYQIQVSSDGTHWSSIKTITGNTRSGLVEFDGLSGWGRYVRIYCTSTSSLYNNYSLYDFKVFGQPSTNLAAGRPASSSTIEGSTWTATMAVDDDPASRWSSGQWLQNGLTTAWLSIDLGATSEITEVSLDWEAAYAADYQIQVSHDNSTWTTIKTVAGNHAAGSVILSGLSGEGRYVRIYCTKTSDLYNNYSLYDVKVFGSTVAPASLSVAGTLNDLAAASVVQQAVPTADVVVGSSANTEATELIGNTMSSSLIATPIASSAITAATALNTSTVTPMTNQLRNARQLRPIARRERVMNRPNLTKLASRMVGPHPWTRGRSNG